jgi:hypothetical protein
LLSSEPFPGQQAQRGGKRHFLGRTRPRNCVPADSRFSKLGKVRTHARHRPRTQRLYPGTFQRIEHGASLGFGRRLAIVHTHVVEAKAERHRVCGAARFCNRPGRKA